VLAKIGTTFAGPGLRRGWRDLSVRANASHACARGRATRNAKWRSSIPIFDMATDPSSDRDNRRSLSEDCDATTSRRERAPHEATRFRLDATAPTACVPSCARCEWARTPRRTMFQGIYGAARTTDSTESKFPIGIFLPRSLTSTLRNAARLRRCAAHD